MTLIKLTFAVFFSAMMAGCATMAPLNGMNNQQRGMIGGGVLGGALAVLSGNTGGLRVPAAIAAGAVVGNMMTDPECTYYMHDERSHTGNQVSQYQGTETRDCRITGSSPDRPSFRLPAGGGFPVYQVQQ